MPPSKGKNISLNFFVDSIHYSFWTDRNILEETLRDWNFRFASQPSQLAFVDLKRIVAGEFVCDTSESSPHAERCTRQLHLLI